MQLLAQADPYVIEMLSQNIPAQIHTLLCKTHFEGTPDAGIYCTILCYLDTGRVGDLYP